MSWPKDVLEAVFGKTRGTCAYCDKQLVWDNYGKCKGTTGPREAWEVDKWRPRVRCSSQAQCDNVNNLWPACCRCGDPEATMTGEEFIRWRWSQGLKVPGSWVKTLNLS